VEHPRIYDQQGQQRDWNWLVASFGNITLERSQASEGSIFRIVKLQDAEGPAVQVANVMDQDGLTMEGIRVVRYWPDAPTLPAWTSPISMWRSQGVYGTTNVSGDIGYGMGHGDYYFPPGPGASGLWVADDAGPSDFIGGLGMLGGTNHRHLDVYFQLTPAKASPSPEPPEPLPEEPPHADPSDRWQKLFAKLDQIIAMLERQVGP
jgi:hypothetical protein